MTQRYDHPKPMS